MHNQFSRDVQHINERASAVKPDKLTTGKLLLVLFAVSFLIPGVNTVSIAIVWPIIWPVTLLQQWFPNTFVAFAMLYFLALGGVLALGIVAFDHLKRRYHGKRTAGSA